jgi:beta-lactamase class A
MRAILLLALLVTGITSGAPAQDTLAHQVRARIARHPGARVGVAYLHLGRPDSLFLDADTVFHAASTMKVPVMIELFRAVDEGRLSLDQPILLVNRFGSIVDASPYELSPADDSDSTLYARVGERIPLRELVELMIVRSSNLATNALIPLAGGGERVTATMRTLGARDIQVRRGVEDGKAYERGLNNTTTARDLAAIMRALARDEAASAASCRAMREVLLRQEFNGEIPAGLPPGTPVAHKTGSITAVLHDAAIVMPRTGAPYVLVVLTRGIRDESESRALIADISRLVYAHAAGAAATDSR